MTDECQVERVTNEEDDDYMMDIDHEETQWEGTSPAHMVGLRKTLRRLLDMPPAALSDDSRLQIIAEQEDDHVVDVDREATQWEGAGPAQVAVLRKTLGRLLSMPAELPVVRRVEKATKRQNRGQPLTASCSMKLVDRDADDVDHNETQWEGACQAQIAELRKTLSRLLEMPA